MKLISQKIKNITFSVVAIALSLATALFVSSCDTSGDDPDVPTGRDSTRTVLVYMIADNSLGRNNLDEDDIAEMQLAARAGALGKTGRLLVYHSPAGVSSGLAVPTLKEITADGKVTVVKTYDNLLLSVDVERMRQVVRDVETVAPADERGLVLWSHGNGWEESPKSRAFGEESPEKFTMKVSSLAEALSATHFSYIYFDCCLMATVEVAYELRHVTDVIIASGTELLSEGTRYDLNVPTFFARPFNPEATARTTFDYFDALAGNRRTCTMSVIQTGYLDNLAEVMRTVMETGAVPTVTIDDQQSYMTGSSTIYDMERYISTLNCVDSLRTKAINALHVAVPVALTTPSLFGYFPMNYYCGLGTFVLATPADASYKGYDQQQWWTDVVSHNPAYNP